MEPPVTALITAGDQHVQGKPSPWFKLCLCSMNALLSVLLMGDAASEAKYLTSLSGVHAGALLTDEGLPKGEDSGNTRA